MRNFFFKLESRLAVRSAPSADDARRLRMARDLCRNLSWIPGLLMVGVGNSVAMYASREESDIDLFVVAKTGRLWLVRTLVTAVVALWRSRKTAVNHRDAFCLSFFVDEAGMDFSSFAIENDVYLAYWVATMKPVWDPYGTYARFVAANAEWTDVTDAERKKNTIFLTDRTAAPYRERLGLLWSLAERLCKSVLLPRTLRSYEKLGRPWGIRVEQHVLKFHDDDARIRIRDEVVR